MAHLTQLDQNKLKLTEVRSHYHSQSRRVACRLRNPCEQVTLPLVGSIHYVWQLRRECKRGRVLAHDEKNNHWATAKALKGDSCSAYFYFYIYRPKSEDFPSHHCCWPTSKQLAFSVIFVPNIYQPEIWTHYAPHHHHLLSSSWSCVFVFCCWGVCVCVLGGGGGGRGGITKFQSFLPSRVYLGWNTIISGVACFTTCWSITFMSHYSLLLSRLHPCIWF